MLLRLLLPLVLIVACKKKDSGTKPATANPVGVEIPAPAQSTTANSDILNESKNTVQEKPVPAAIPAEIVNTNRQKFLQMCEAGASKDLVNAWKMIYSPTCSGLWSALSSEGSVNITGVKGDVSLEIVKTLENLKSISITDFSEVRDLRPLAALPHLESIYIRDTLLSGLDDLTASPSLNMISIINMPVITNFEALATMKNLRRLELEQIGKINSLSGLEKTQLQFLGLTKVGGIDAQSQLIPIVQQLSGLTSLKISDLAITDCSFLAKMANLNVVIISNSAGLTSIEGCMPPKASYLSFEGDTNITMLWTDAVQIDKINALMLANTGVKDLTPLKNASTLGHLFIRGLTVDSLAPLKDHPTLASVIGPFKLATKTAETCPVDGKNETIRKLCGP